MTRYEAIEKTAKELLDAIILEPYPTHAGMRELATQNLIAAVSLPEDNVTVNAELYMPSSVHDQIMEILNPYLDTGDSRTAPDWAVAVALAIEPMPYKVIREGDKVRFL